MSDTPLTDRLKIPSEALLLLGHKGVPEKIVQAILTLGNHSRDLERVARQNTEALTALYDFAKRRIAIGFVPPQAKLADDALTAWRAFEEKYK